MNSKKYIYFLLGIADLILFYAVKNGHCHSETLISEAKNDVNSSLVSEILEFWKEQENRMNIDFQKNITLFLGTTGSGKSAVISLITNDELKSVEIYNGSETFRVVDNFGRISQNSTILSQTLIPELIVDNETEAAYFDCPGFKDTRGIKYDITVTYLIRKLLELSNSVKFVFVIAHSQVLDGGDRHGILELAKHASSLFKNIEKFSNGIALVVSKVDNVSKLSKGLLSFVDDDNLVKNIKRFLSNVKNDLEKLNSNGSLSLSEINVNEGAIKFIDILLRNGIDGQPRIGLFRKPLESGFLSNMAFFPAEKNFIKTMINQSLQYVRSESTDFGFSLSEESKNHVNAILNEIKSQAVAQIKTIGNEIIIFYDDQLSDYKSLTVLYGNAYSLNHTLHGAITDDPQLCVNNFVNVMKLTENYQVTKNTNAVQKHMEHIDFLLKLTENSNSDFILITDAISKVVHNIEKFLNKLAGKIENGILALVFEQYDRISWGILRAESQNSDLIYLEDLMLNAKTNLPTLDENKDIGLFLQQLVNSSIAKTVDPSPESLVKISTTIDLLNSLHIEFSNSFKSSISNEANKIVRQLDASVKWYKFLNDLYEKLSDINLKTSRLKKGAKDLIEECSVEEEQKIKVNETSLRNFLKAIDIEINNNDIEFLEINKFQSDALKNVIAATINDDIKCSSDGSTISGFNVKMSNAIDLQCWQNSETIKVFAIDKILIDIDIDRKSNSITKRLSFIAPVWKIMGNREINMDGNNGRTNGFPASDGNQYSMNGEHGLPGNPGFSGGIFFGIGNKFIGGILEGHANGGNGGSGQHGGDGYYFKNEYHSGKKTSLKGASILGAALLGYLIGGPPGAMIGAGGSGALLATLGSSPEIEEKLGYGGFGGAPGISGLKGDIQLVDLSNRTHFKTRSLNGEDGNPGKGGYDGKRKERGLDGLYRLGIRYPSPAEKFTEQNKLQIISAYKDFATRSILKNIRQTSVQNFATKIDQYVSQFLMTSNISSI